MRVLVAHNHYREPGGEDAVFEAEVALLRERGHTVVTVEEDNRQIREAFRVPLSGVGIWSRGARLRILRVIDETRPDVAHFHNTHARLTPSVYYACAERGVPVVQTLHNYRLICPAATLYRSGDVCELCVGRAVPLPGIRYACYRGSRIQSAMVAAMLGYHGYRGTWAGKVTAYVALTEFARAQFIEGGLPPRRIFVKPNFVHPDPGPKNSDGEFALFVGRLSPEKGVETILEAARRLGDQVPLWIVGDGPMSMRVSQASQRIGNVRVLGYQSRARVVELMKRARFLVFPSGWYEGFPMVIAEAFACGLPVVAVGLGAAAEIVGHGDTGLLSEPRSVDGFAQRMSWAWQHPEECARMGRAARLRFETLYTPERNYEILLSIYQVAMRSRRS
jgi:glycosyltransferase involved in cell wall biosynthesis